MSYLRYLGLLAHSGVQHILWCVLCSLCCQFIWIVHFWFPLRYSLTFIARCRSRYKADLAVPVVSFISSSMGLIRSTKPPNLQLFSKRTGKNTKHVQSIQFLNNRNKYYCNSISFQKVSHQLNDIEILKIDNKFTFVFQAVSFFLVLWLNIVSTNVCVLWYVTSFLNTLLRVWSGNDVVYIESEYLRTEWGFTL